MKILGSLAAVVVSFALVSGHAPASVAAPAPGTPKATSPAVSSIWNFRDVAGDGIVLADGTRMATGVVYRSGKLQTLSDSDSAVLTGLGITDIYDLRGPSAAKSSPDPEVAGASRKLINIFAGHHVNFKGKSKSAARAHMRSMNLRFVTDSAQRSRIAKVLKAIAADTGPVLIHCTEGKDRTGWIAAMLQRIAGAKESTMVEEYLLSNTYRADLIKTKVEAARAERGDKWAAIVSELETVRPSYLEAGLNKAKAKYGSLRGYLTKGLKLSTKTLASLRARLRGA